jgi:N-acyl-L-homoserine lactone synthetase
LAAALTDRSGVRFAVAATEDDRDICFRLRRAAVTERGWDIDNERLERDAFDDAAVHVIGRRDGQPACCGRLVLPPGPLPTEVACGITVEPAGNVVDVGRMTVVAHVRRADRAVFLSLLAALYLETRKRGYATGCGMMAANVRSLLRHLGVGVEVLGPDRPFLGDLRAPVRFDVAVHGPAVLERWR